MRAYFEEPMTVAGTFASGTDPQTADLELALTMGGETMDVGIKLMGDKGWMRMLDQWYEAPSEMMSGSTYDEAQIAEMIRLTNELGVDPATWFKDLTLVGEEAVEGVAGDLRSGRRRRSRVPRDAQLARHDTRHRLRLLPRVDRPTPRPLPGTLQDTHHPALHHHHPRSRPEDGG